MQVSGLDVPQHIDKVRKQIHHPKTTSISAPVLKQISKAIINGELNVVVGPRGSGKTAAVKKALETFEEVTQVRTSGLFGIESSKILHSFITQIQAQAGKQVTPEEDPESNISEYERERSATAAFKAQLVSILQIGKEGVDIIIVIDEFDSFATKRQSLLYFLLELFFEFPQKIAIIAITCCFDYIELLEKRVKSRFRQAQTIMTYVEKPDLLTLLHSWLILPDKPQYSKWNAVTKALLEHQDFEDLLARDTVRSKDLFCLSNLVELAMLHLDPSEPFLTTQHFKDSSDTLNINSYVEIGKGLSFVSICLLLSMKGLEDREISNYNFELVYSEYQQYLASQNQTTYEKGICLKAFENMLALGLLSWTTMQHQIQFHPVQLNVLATDIKKILESQSVRPQWSDVWFQRYATQSS